MIVIYRKHTLMTLRVNVMTLQMAADFVELFSEPNTSLEDDNSIKVLKLL